MTRLTRRASGGSRGADRDCGWRPRSSPPLAWLLVVYLGSLAALLVQSFYRLDDFTGIVDRTLDARHVA